MREIVFMPKAWQDLGWWIHNENKLAKKIHAILENISKTPFTGLAQPEPLKSIWSRRINLEHRIVYKVESSRVVIVSLFGHYQL